MATIYLFIYLFIYLRTQHKVDFDSVERCSSLSKDTGDTIDLN